MRKLIGCLILLSLLVTVPVYGQDQAEPELDALTKVVLPLGFQMTLFSDQVPNARSLE